VGGSLSCPAHDFLAARVQLDQDRLLALFPDVDARLVQQYLNAIPAVGRGEAAAGPIGQLTQRQRFYWLVAPRSTIIQTSSVHTGLSENPAATLEHLMRTMVGCAPRA